jgi:uncharacterized LabA/DUF88 family protein
LRAIVYIDGFNLYYGSLRPNPALKWMNPKRLVALIFPDINIRSLKYFTANVIDRPSDPTQSLRQQTYFRALRTLPDFEIIRGHYLSHAVKMPLETPVNGERYATVIKTEEKGSDVNLASLMLVDCFKDKFDVAVLISNDSDLTLPLKMVREVFAKQVYVVNPQIGKKRSIQLGRNCDRHRDVRKGHLIGSQFENPMIDSIGEFHKPTSWS